MISARVYSLESLPQEQRMQISDGLDYIGQYVGGIGIKGFSVIKSLPMRDKAVAVEKIGYKNFDTMTELHLFSMPISVNGRPNALGASFIGSGIALVGTTSKNKQSKTVSHEVAHSLGYVLPDSPQTIKALGSHCSDVGCLMYHDDSADYSAFDRLSFKLQYGSESAKIEDLVDVIDSHSTCSGLCSLCRADMLDTHEENIGILRHRRVMAGRVHPLVNIVNNEQKHS